MTDPFFMLMLIENLGRDYVVWDKTATIRFKRPGVGRVHAHFHLDPARVEKTLYVRRKDSALEGSRKS